MSPNYHLPKERASLSHSVGSQLVDMAENLRLISWLEIALTTLSPKMSWKDPGKLARLVWKSLHGTIPQSHLFTALVMDWPGGVIVPKRQNNESQQKDTIKEGKWEKEMTKWELQMQRQGVQDQEAGRHRGWIARYTRIPVGCTVWSGPGLGKSMCQNNHRHCPDDIQAHWRSATQPTPIICLEQTTAKKQGQVKTIQGDFNPNPVFGVCVWKVQLKGQLQMLEQIGVGS